IDSGPDRFVAVSESGRIVTSTDAVQWTLANSGTMNRLENLASGNGIFVATGVPDTVIRSTDGTNWQSTGWQELDTVVRGVAFANGLFFLLASEFCCGPKLYVSGNGREWSINRMPRSEPSSLLFSLPYANSNYVAVGTWRGPDDASLQSGP